MSLWIFVSTGDKEGVPGAISRDFMFQITEMEAATLVSQNVIPHKKHFGGSKRGMRGQVLFLAEPLWDVSLVTFSTCTPQNSLDRHPCGFLSVNISALITKTFVLAALSIQCPRPMAATT